MLFLLYDPKVRMLLDALMFELVLVWPMVILLKSEMQRLRCVVEALAVRLKRDEICLCKKYE